MPRLPFPAAFRRIVLLVCLLPAAVQAQRRAEKTPRAEKPYSFYSHGPYCDSVPKPSSILGYEAGETHSTFRDQERALLAMAAAAKDRVRVVEYGKSVEGRPLRLLIVSAAENLGKLEAIRARNLQLADPRKLASPAEADPILKSNPCITWINHCIHGDETASFEAVMWTLYTLAASNAPDIKATLQNSVVILNPVFNPDGHERFVVYYNSLALGSPDNWSFEKDVPWTARGRGNHYRFDMNRDKLAQSQPETRQETAVYLQWMPQVFVDEHGQPENYFFPPTSQPTNRHVDPARAEKWTDIFGRANGAVFDQYGWNYVTRETYDFFGPFYLDSWTTLSGAIGMTYETDGGGNLARRRDDGTISTLRDATAHHVETALSTLVTAAKRREALLKDFAAYRRSALTPPQNEPLQRVVILPGPDPNRAAYLAEILTRVGIEVQEVKTAFRSQKAHAYLPELDEKGKPVEAGAQTFPVGSLIVEMAQPQGRVARAFLEPDPDFTPEFVKEQNARRERNEKKNDAERKEEYEFYDITAWALPFTCGVKAFWTEDASPVQARLLQANAQGKVVLSTQTGGIKGEKATVAYVFRYDRNEAATLALRLLQEEYRLSAVTKPVKIGGTEWPRGTLVARVGRNPESLHARIAALAKELHVEVQAVNSGYSDEGIGLNSDYVIPLKKPSIAVVTDDTIASASYGSLWYLLEREFGLEFTPVRLSRLRSDEQINRFNVIIFPDGGGYAGAMGKPVQDSLRDWMNGGGVVIGLEGGGQWLMDKDVALTTAVEVGHDDSTDAAKPADAPMGAPPTADKPKPKKPTSLPGAIFRAHIDPTHFLGYGYEGGDIAVPLAGSTFLKPSKKGSNVVTFGAGPLKLSGFIWPENTEPMLANTAYVIDEPVGSGHAILFLSDPTFRALWPGLNRLLLSGILFGPTRTPLSAP